MNKKLFLAFALSTSLALSGCSEGESKNEDVKIGDEGLVENVVSYKIKKMEVTSVLEPSEPTDIVLSYSPQDSSKQFLDLVMEVTNESKKEETTNTLFEGTKFYIDGIEYNVDFYTEQDGKTSINAYGTLNPKDSTYVHFVTEVNEKDLPDTVDFSLSINEKITTMKLNRKVLLEAKKNIEKGETLTKEGYYEISFIDAYTSKRVDPETPSDFYSYYESKQGKTYGVVKFTVKNTSSNALDVDEIFKVKAIVDDYYEYTGFTCADLDGDLNGFASLDPMVQATAYALIEIPDDMLSKNIEFKITTAGEVRYTGLTA